MSEHPTISDEQLSAECYKICARAAAVPILKRTKFIFDQIDKLPISTVLKLSLQNMMSVTEVSVRETALAWEKIAVFIFGVIFVIAMIVLAVIIPHPTSSQFFVFRVVLALSAAGVAGAIPGFINLHIGDAAKPWLRAGGALAVFALVYMVNPAKFIIN